MQPSWTKPRSLRAQRVSYPIDTLRPRLSPSHLLIRTIINPGSMLLREPEEPYAD
jgi:hypothetical protein